MDIYLLFETMENETILNRVVEKKKPNYPFYATWIICIILLLIVIIPKSEKVSSNYDDMTPGQLVDRKLDFANQINVLEWKTQQIDEILCPKAPSLCGSDITKSDWTWVVEETPTTQLNKALNLQ